MLTFFKRHVYRNQSDKEHNNLLLLLLLSSLLLFCFNFIFISLWSCYCFISIILFIIKLVLFYSYYLVSYHNYYYYRHMILNEEIFIGSQIVLQGVTKHFIDERQRLSVFPKDVVAAPKRSSAVEEPLQLLLIAEEHALDLAVQLGALLSEVHPNRLLWIAHVLLHSVMRDIRMSIIIISYHIISYITSDRQQQ